MISVHSVSPALKESYAAIGNPQSVLVGLSGGADSVALLLCLCELQQGTGCRVYAVHVNHGLRDTAVRDERFCMDLCDRLNVPLVVKHVHISQQRNIEATAREARYAAFSDVMNSCKSQVLALAHHMDDQAETMMLHLMHGAGLTGLAGMKMLNGQIWRPFLQVRRSQLREYVLARGYDWCEDETNSDSAFTRNRIRMQIMPQIEACSPEAVSCMCRAARIMQSEDEYLEQLAEKWLDKYASKSNVAFLMSKPLTGEHVAMQRRILRKYAQKLGMELEFDHTERLRGMLLRDKGTIENLPASWRALKTQERLHFLHDTLEGPVVVGKFEICAEACEAEYPLHILPASQNFDLQLRTRRAGDYIQPFGMKGTKSLKEHMIDIGMDRPFRDAWPLICRGSEVLWIVGIGASEKLRVHEGEKSLKLIYKGSLPDKI